jgi:hypothetical protein
VDLVVYDDDEKRYVPWLVALAAVLLVALVTAGVTFLLARQASGTDGADLGGLTSPAPASAPPSASPSGGGTAASASCLTALLRADEALERSVAVEQALTEHTGIVDELLAERITLEQALERALPVLTAGATERQAFEEQLAAYTQAREACPAA